MVISNGKGKGITRVWYGTYGYLEFPSGYSYMAKRMYLQLLETQGYKLIHQGYKVFFSKDITRLVDCYA